MSKNDDAGGGNGDDSGGNGDNCGHDVDDAGGGSGHDDAGGGDAPGFLTSSSRDGLLFLMDSTRLVCLNNTSRVKSVHEPYPGLLGGGVGGWRSWGMGMTMAMMMVMVMYKDGSGGNVD